MGKEDKSLCNFHLLQQCDFSRINFVCDFKYNTVQRSKALFQIHIHVIEKYNIMEGSNRRSKSSECIEKIIGYAFNRPSKIKICISCYQMLSYQKKKKLLNYRKSSISKNVFKIMI